MAGRAAVGRYHCAGAWGERTLAEAARPFLRLEMVPGGLVMAKKRVKTTKRTSRKPGSKRTGQEKSASSKRGGAKRARTSRGTSTKARMNTPSSSRSTKPIRIFAKQQLGRDMARRITSAAAQTGFDFPATLAGRTTHFQVYYQNGFANGPAIAQGVLGTCERDYTAQVAFFSGIQIPTMPVNILIGSGIGGAYHYGCSAVDVYCDGDSSPNPDIDLTRMLAVAEEVEGFEATQNKGWDCGASNGEGLSRVLATELYPAQLDGFSTAAAWLDSNRADWVSKTDPTDQNGVSTGCAVLFLNYLRYQLNFSWQQIIQAAGATLEQTYQGVTGKTGGFAPFKALLGAHFPPGQPSNLATDNPFPL